MDISDIIITFFISFLPFFELKGAIPYALACDIDIVLTFCITVVGNILSIPFCFWLLSKIGPFLIYNKHKNIRVLSLKVAQYSKRNSRSGLRKYGYISLLFFVAIPFPGTGTYVGSIAAYLFALDKKKSFIYLSIGVVFSAIILLSVTYFGVSLFQKITEL